MAKNIAALLPELTDLEVDIIGMVMTWRGRQKSTEWKRFWSKHEIMLWDAGAIIEELDDAIWGNSEGISAHTFRRSAYRLKNRLRKHLRGTQ